MSWFDILSKDFDNDPDVDSDNYKYSHNITTMLDNYVKWAKDKINENVLHERFRETHTPVSYDKDGNWSYMKNETFDAIVDKMKAERKGNLEDKKNFRLFINRMNAETYPKEEAGHDFDRKEWRYKKYWDDETESWI